MRYLKATLTLVTLLSGALSSQADDGAYKEFKSWQVSCSQTRSCSMRQFLSDNPLSGFELQRSGKPEAPVVLVVSPSDNALIEGEGVVEVTISVDGSEPLVVTGSSVSAEPGTYAFTLNGDFINDGLIDSLKKAYDSNEYKEFMSSRGFGVVWGDQAHFTSFMAEADKAMGDAMRAAGLARG